MALVRAFGHIPTRDDLLTIIDGPQSMEGLPVKGTTSLSPMLRASDTKAQKEEARLFIVANRASHNDFEQLDAYFAATCASG